MEQSSNALDNILAVEVFDSKEEECKDDDAVKDDDDDEENSEVNEVGNISSPPVAVDSESPVTIADLTSATSSLSLNEQSSIFEAIYVALVEIKSVDTIGKLYSLTVF